MVLLAGLPKVSRVVQERIASEIELVLGCRVAGRNFCEQLLELSDWLLQCRPWQEPTAKGNELVT